jgi:sec-independent protein translocase protein TatA
MPSWIGPWEIAIVVIIALLIFGPKKLPDLGSSLGKSIRGFKSGLKEGQDELSKAVAEVKETDGGNPVTTKTAEAPSSAEATVTTATAAEATTATAASADATATAELPKCWGTYESGHEACLQCSVAGRCAEANVEPPVG